MLAARQPVLGVEGPFPRIPLTHPLERRWLHYAFIGRDTEAGRQHALVANLASLGGDGTGVPGMETAILLIHDDDSGWSSSQWNARVPAAPWSSYCQRHTCGENPLGGFFISAVKGWPSVELNLRRTSTPSINACATFDRPQTAFSAQLYGRHWMRWQAEPGVLADGIWRFADSTARCVQAVGYHERVRGCWSWPSIGGWVFGFCNEIGEADSDLSSGQERPPRWSVVFALVQPGESAAGQSCALMLWRNGHLIRHVPRRTLRVTAAGQLRRDLVSLVPWQASLFGTPAMAPVPAALCVDGEQGCDRIHLRVRSSTAARLVVPSETGLQPFSVHEVLSDFEVEISLGGQRHTFAAPGIVEFAGGAASGGWNVD